jgi:hypothetical protein
MKKRFPMRARGERGEQYSRFSQSPGKLKAICIALVFCASAVVALPAQTFTTLTSFDGANGLNPDLMSLVQGNAGNVYETTYSGGQAMPAACVTPDHATSRRSVSRP